MKVWQEGYVRVNEVNLHYHRTGHDKPTILLAHGIADNGLCWTRLALALEDRYDLVLYDARGHGFSDQPGDYSLESHVADAIGLITALKLNQPILLGHSMGGAKMIKSYSLGRKRNNKLTPR
jgi:N-formylmaleamate deformylase